MAMINKRAVQVDAAMMQLRKTILHECDLLNVFLPRFCYHDALSIAGNCRMCLVETNISVKPVIACATVFSSKLEILTDSILVKIARENILEFLLINHPLDCPICDQGGECDLQDQTIIFGSDRGRFFEPKRSVEDREFNSLIKAVMTRCIHCTRCIRYADEILGEPLLGTLGRGMFTEIGTYVSEMFSTLIIGNMADICPVGALTFSVSAYSSRSWELIGIDTIDALDSMCSNIRIDVRGNAIIRILPRLNPRVNGEWITDEIRVSFGLVLMDKVCYPMYRFSLHSPFMRCSWERAFNIMTAHVGLELRNYRSKRFSFFVGPGADIISTSMFKYLSCVTALDNVSYNISTFIDSRTEFILDISHLEHSIVDFFFMIACDPKKESPILHITLRRATDALRSRSTVVIIEGRGREGRGVVFSGSGELLDYKLQHVNLGMALVDHLLKGDRFYCTDVKFDENCYYLKGESLSFFSETVNRATYFAYTSLLKRGIRIHYVIKGSHTVCVFEDAYGALNRSKTMFWAEDEPIINIKQPRYYSRLEMENKEKDKKVSHSEIFVQEGCVFVLAAKYFTKENLASYRKDIQNDRSSIACFINNIPAGAPNSESTRKNVMRERLNSPYVLLNKNLPVKRCCIYIGPYSYLAELVGAHFVFPSNTFVEKKGAYINVLGHTQHTVRVVKLPVHLWSDEWIAVALSLYLGRFYPTVFCKNEMKRLFNRLKKHHIRDRTLPEPWPLHILKKFFRLRRSFGLPEQHSYNPMGEYDPLWPRKKDIEILIRKYSSQGWFAEQTARLFYAIYEKKCYDLYCSWKYPERIRQPKMSFRDAMLQISKDARENPEKLEKAMIKWWGRMWR